MTGNRPRITFANSGAPANAACARRAARAGLAGVAGLAIAGCEGVQSALAPGGPNADSISTIAWVIFIGGALIFIGVMAMTAWAVFGPEHRRGWLANRRLVVGGGIVFPVVVLTALLVWTLFVGARLVTAERAPVARIEVVGEQWWWRVRYLGDDGRVLFETANEIRMPVDAPVELRLLAADVIHSFWVPSLAGKLDMIPGRVNRMTLEASRPGVYRGQCAEYCGGPHALMAFWVVAQTPDEFAQWIARQSAPPPSLDGTAAMPAGLERFLAHGCGVCHTIRGTPARGDRGPDLTHVGSRISLAAATLPNNVGTMAGWIASSQRIKPDNLMPSFHTLGGDDLLAIARFLSELR